ncbi:MAG: hypothetical protein H7Z14_21715 [Anaerolineae bacterium]|nr:hypothetical protein [Phycisphaerae bacterium]
MPPRIWRGFGLFFIALIATSGIVAIGERVRRMGSVAVVAGEWISRFAVEAKLGRWREMPSHRAMVRALEI